MLKTALLTSAALLGAMSPAERLMGRYMRAPDEHGDAGAAGGAAGEAPPAAEGAEGGAGDAAPPVDTAKALEEEFGQVDPPATDAEDGSAEGEQDQGAKPKSEAQTRIDEITASRREAERERDEATRQAEYWRGKAEGTAPKAEGDGKPTIDPDKEPDPVNYEYGEADTKFIADTSRFHARQEFREQQQQAEARAEVARLDARWTENVAAAAERFPDFKEKVLDTANKGDWPCPPIIALGIRDSDVGPDVAYHLATNVDEAKRIAGMNPVQQAREFGRLEGRFLAERGSKNTNASARRVTAAAPPPQNLARGSGGRFAVNADTDDFAAFEKTADSMMVKR